MDKEFLTDQEMSALESGGGTPDFIPDADISKYDTSSNNNDDLDYLLNGGTPTPSFAERFKLSFGSPAEIQKLKDLEAGAGLRGRPDVGDIADVAGGLVRELGFVGGSIAGGLSGGPAGGILGAGAGSGLGEYFRQRLGELLGVQKDTTKEEQLKEVMQEAAMGSASEIGGKFVLEPAMKVAGKALKPLTQKVGSVSREILTDVLSRTTSAPQKAIEQILSATKPERKLIKEAASSKTTITDVAKSLSKEVKKYDEITSKAFSEALEATKKIYPYKKTGKLLVQRELNDATKGIPGIFRDFRVAVTDLGKKLNFDKLNSAIVSEGERKNLQRMMDTVTKQKDFSVQGVQDVAARLYQFRRYAEGGIMQSSALANKVYGKYVESIGQVYPELAKLRTEFSARKEITDTLNDVFKLKDTDPKAVKTAVSRLKSIYNEDNEIYLDTIKNFGKLTGNDFVSTLAGSQFTKEAPGIMRTAIVAGAIGGAQAIGVGSPVLWLTLPLFSPRAVQFILRSANAGGEVTKAAMEGIAGQITKQASKVGILEGIRSAIK